MNWLEGFFKLSVSTKSVVLSVAGLIPFWVVTIFLFNKQLYDRHDYLILACFCLCFSLLLYALSLVTALFMVRAKGIKNEKNEPAFYIAGMSAIMSMSFFILVGYYCEWSLKTFLAFEFGYILLLFIKWAITDFRRSVERAKQKMKADQS